MRPLRGGEGRTTRDLRDSARVLWILVWCAAVGACLWLIFGGGA